LHDEVQEDWRRAKTVYKTLNSKTAVCRVRFDDGDLRMGKFAGGLIVMSGIGVDAQHPPLVSSNEECEQNVVMLERIMACIERQS
jgi:hypothetical protein